MTLLYLMSTVELLERIESSKLQTELKKRFTDLEDKIENLKYELLEFQDGSQAIA